MCTDPFLSKLRKISSGQRNPQSCLGSWAGKVQVKWTFKGHRLSSVYQPYQELQERAQKRLLICVFTCHALKFRSEVRHVLISYVCHPREGIPAGLPSQLTLVAGCARNWAWWPCVWHALALSAEEAREAWVGYFVLLMWTLIKTLSSWSALNHIVQ